MNAPRLLSKEVRQGFSYAFPYDDVIERRLQGADEAHWADRRQRARLRPGRIPLPDRPGQGQGTDPRGRLQGGRHLRVHGRRERRDASRRSPSSSRRTSQQMGFDLELISVDYATIESTVYGDAPAEERPHLDRRLGLVARLQRPLEPALAELHRGQHRWRRLERRAPGSTRASRRSWPRRSTSRARSNSTN